MTPVRAMLELAERAEQATGPDRALDADIAAALHVKQLTYQSPEWIKDPEFTYSLDAAMTLQPEKLKILVDQRERSWVVTLWSDTITPVAESEAATEALARTAAALRARAADTPDSQRGDG